VWPAGERPVLYVIACGARPAGRLPEFVAFAQAEGWDVCVIVTPDGSKFVDGRLLAGLTGHPVRVHYKNPDEPDVLPPPDAVVVAPATFNMVNKLAAGISDTLAAGLVNEAIGLGLPVAAVPWATGLARHPAFQRSIALLRDWGVTIILGPERLPASAAEEAGFPWAELRAGLAHLRRHQGGRE
jgi:phosphopantothenoylcysteine synthetase/decarboxylase